MPAPLETRTVSRKTPGDGKLELTRPAAQQIGPAGATLSVQLGGRSAAGRLESFKCTCRGPEHRHVHYFLQCELFKTLEPGKQVELDWDPGSRRVGVHSSPLD